MPVGLGLGRDHEPHYGRREGMVLMPYDPLWVGQLAGLHTLGGRIVEPAAGQRGTHCHRQYSFRRQPEVTQRDKGVTTQTCFLPRGRRAQAHIRHTWGLFMDVYSDTRRTSEGCGPFREKAEVFCKQLACLFVRGALVLSSFGGNITSIEFKQTLYS